MVIRSSRPSQHTIPTAQGRIRVDHYDGHGHAFVLMHGFPDNRRIYDPLVPHLVSAGRRVLAFDFLGYGDSDHQSGATYGFRQQLEDLEAVMDALDLHEIVPVGHDASGPAALNLALKRPERVSSICLLNSFYAASPSIRIPELILLFATGNLKALATAVLQDEEQFARLLRFQEGKFHDSLPPALQARFLSALAPIINANFGAARTSAVAFARMTEQLFSEVGRNTARLPDLAKLDKPVQLIWGEHDPYLTRGVADDLVPLFRNATLHVLPAGHWPQIDMPETVARLMLAQR